MSMKVLTPEQFGELVSLSPKTIVGLCAAGRIPGARKMGRRWRIPDWALTQSPREKVAFHASLEKETQAFNRRSRGLRSYREQSVYFIQCNGEGGPIKIGITESIERRMSDLVPSNPYPLMVLAVVPGGKSFEQELHSRFKASRIRGEWFGCSEELLKLIADLLEATST